MTIVYLFAEKGIDTEPYRFYMASPDNSNLNSDNILLEEIANKLAGELKTRKGQKAYTIYPKVPDITMIPSDERDPYLRIFNLDEEPSTQAWNQLLKEKFRPLFKEERMQIHERYAKRINEIKRRFLKPTNPSLVQSIYHQGQ